MVIKKCAGKEIGNIFEYELRLESILKIGRVLVPRTLGLSCNSLSFIFQYIWPLSRGQSTLLIEVNRSIPQILTFALFYKFGD